MQSITWKIGGEAGFGIMTTGHMFSRVTTRHGYHIFDYVEYPSLIRGGHNVYEVRVDDQPVYAQEYGVDVLVALNRDTVDRHKDHMKDGGVILYDSEQFPVEQSEIPNKSVVLYNLPLAQLTKEAGATKVMENNVALAASMALLDMDLKVLYEIIEQSFAKKGTEIIDENKAAANAGFSFVSTHKPDGFTRALPRRNDTSVQLVVSGNEAVGIGAIAAGCSLYAAYPMTPASSLLHFLAKYGSKHGMVVKHAEDEISVINMGVGAGYAGVRAMVGTSGGGFSLMTEGLGLAGVTETPLVILEGQRPGPATGMPTWTAQGDLQFLIHASQDEFPRIILAPGDVTEAFYLTTHAFNLAEYYQTPVFILSDKYLAEGHQSTPPFDTRALSVNRGKLLSWPEGDIAEGYLRYRDTDDGIPPRALPGMNKALFVANSYEHNEYGWSTEDAAPRIKQVNRRNRKLATYAKTIALPKIYGDADAELTLVAWGTTKGPILQALQELKAEGYTRAINFLHLVAVWPFPARPVASTLGSAKQTLLLEGNSQAQMGQLIRQETGITFEHTYLRYDGRPFYPEDIKAQIKKLLG